MKAHKSRLGRMALLSMAMLAGCDVDLADPGYGHDIDIDIDVDPPRYAASEPFSLSVPVAGQARLRLEGVNGEVWLRGSDAPGPILITGHKRVRSESQADADAHLGDVQVQVVEGADEILVATDQPRTGNRSYQVDYQITLPRGFHVEVEHVNGAVKLEGLESGAEVDLANGLITGDLTLPPGGTIDLYTTNGEIELEVQRDASAKLSATVSNGTITTSNLTLTGQVSFPRSLTGTLGEGDGTIRLQLVNGDIRVRGR